ncbi:MAG: ABC transporter permease subunit, partial [Proteobacteria bacterium]|nr:ABC transporter permease subunit [Pseudomonadota bacterium]
PLIQIAASFPAPMIYPLALGGLHYFSIGLNVGAGFLILLGVQWYILFNVLAGATTIAPEFRDSFRLIGFSDWKTWRYLFLPAIFPSLVTGWVTAAGGAWNASIVAEFVQYQGHTLATKGLGQLISEATIQGDFPLLAASMLTMIVLVIALNRTLWQALYRLIEQRFRTET